jgi:transcriptional regulator GlxA family with amidase domain
MRIAIPLYDRFTALDAVGPYEVLSRLPGASVTWLAHEPGIVRNDNGMLGIEAQAAYEDLPDPEIVLVPGGTGTNDVLERLVGWIRRAHETSEWTTSVCTGSLLLGAAGVLDGLEATSHWLDLPDLERYGARPTGRRVVEQGKVVTAAGVSSGIDMGLVLAAKIAGPEVAQAIQLGIEYDPQPPFDAGSTDKAPKEIVSWCAASPQPATSRPPALAHSDGRPRHRAVTHAVHARPRECDAIAPGA